MRVFPFDTGAFLGRKSQTFGDRFQLSDFKCDWSPDVPRDLVRTFYGSNEAYLRGNVRKFRPRPPRASRELGTYLEWLEADAEPPAIEVQTAESVALDGAIIVAPRPILEDDVVREAAERLGAECISYDLVDGRAGKQALRRAILDVHIRRGLVDTEDDEPDEFA